MCIASLSCPEASGRGEGKGKLVSPLFLTCNTACMHSGTWPAHQLLLELGLRHSQECLYLVSTCHSFSVYQILSISFIQCWARFSHITILQLNLPHLSRPCLPHHSLERGRPSSFILCLLPSAAIPKKAACVLIGWSIPSCLIPICIGLTSSWVIGSPHLLSAVPCVIWLFSLCRTNRCLETSYIRTQRMWNGS